MDEAVFVRIVQSTGELDGDIQQSLPHLRIRPAIQALVLDTALDAAVFHPLGEDRRHAVQLADVVAGHDVRVQPEVDPALALAGEVVLLLLRDEEVRFGALHGEVHVPVLVMDTPNRAHAALKGVGLHAIGVQQHAAAPDLTDGRGRLRRFVGRAALINGAVGFGHGFAAVVDRTVRFGYGLAAVVDGLVVGHVIASFISITRHKDSSRAYSAPGRAMPLSDC